jgi:hypothetical protein
MPGIFFGHHQMQQADMIYVSQIPNAAWPNSPICALKRANVSRNSFESIQQTPSVKPFFKTLV